MAVALVSVQQINTSISTIISQYHWQKIALLSPRAPYSFQYIQAVHPSCASKLCIQVVAQHKLALFALRVHPGKGDAHLAMLMQLPSFSNGYQIRLIINWQIGASSTVPSFSFRDSHSAWYIGHFPAMSWQGWLSGDKDSIPTASLWINRDIIILTRNNIPDCLAELRLKLPFS